MIYDTKKIQEDAKKDFFATWKKTKTQIPETKGLLAKKLLTASQGGKPHPIQEAIQEIRSVFLDLGFDESENPLFIEEEDVYKQYGPEAPAILDRCYYLANLPRPEIGLGADKKREIKKIVGVEEDKIDSLKGVLRDYKLARIEGDDLVEAIKRAMGVTTYEATRILSLFQELRDLRPLPTKTTLRSHMTAAWFSTIAALQNKRERPIKLFSIGLRFRREQRTDATHLRAHYGASCVVCDEDMDIEAGKEITKKILTALGFKKPEFRKKEATSTYYARDSEYEVYARIKGMSVEIADIGMYSPIALANYEIKYPTFNAGFGIERIIMLRTGLSDVREVMFPQFYQQQKLSDRDIARAISINKTPQTEAGRELARAIYNTASQHADSPSPCSFIAYSGRFMNKEITVKVLEREKNTRLLGPAALNEVFVFNTSVYGIPKQGFGGRADEIRKRGESAAIDYLTALSNYFASEIEASVSRGEAYSGQIKMAKSGGDLNIKIPDHILKYIQAKNKEVVLKGPIFMSVEAEIL